MKITVELEEKDIDDICRWTGEKKKGTAIRKLLVSELMMRRRREIADKFVSGEWGVELAGYEAATGKDQADDQTLHSKWRD
ncbi:MAG TPA: hypothetical protein VIT91_05525 [Chthoniobacterales bacterium]